MYFCTVFQFVLLIMKTFLLFVCLFLRKDNGYAGYNIDIAFTTWILTLQIFPVMTWNHFYPTYITLIENLL